MTCTSVVLVVIVVLREVFICMHIASYIVVREWVRFLAIIVDAFEGMTKHVGHPIDNQNWSLSTSYVDEGLSLEASAR